MLFTYYENTFEKGEHFVFLASSRKLLLFLMNIFVSMQLCLKYDLTFNFQDVYMLLIYMPNLPHTTLAWFSFKCFLKGYSRMLPYLRNSSTCDLKNAVTKYHFIGVIFQK